MKDSIYYSLLNEEQKSVLLLTERIVTEKVRNDPAFHLRRYFSRDIFKAFQEVGITGALLPTEYEGLNVGLLLYSMMTEIIASADASVGLATGATQMLVGMPLTFFGTEEQKLEWLPKIARGETIGCYAQTTPKVGSDVGSMDTKGEIDGDEIIITGEKMFITNAPIAQLALVIVRTGEKRYGGLSAVLVDMEEAKRQGTLTVGKELEKRGLHGSPTSPLSFKECRVSRKNVLGGVNGGWIVLNFTLACSRPMIAAQAVGAMKHAYDLSLRYAGEREQFGKPLAEFQAIYTKLADMKTALDAARELTYRAAWFGDKLYQYGMSKEDVLTFTRLASEAKLFASETAVRIVARNAADIFGGYGYMREQPIATIMDDLEVLPIYEGASNIQRYVIAREELRPRGVNIKL